MVILVNEEANCHMNDCVIFGVVMKMKLNVSEMFPVSAVVCKFSLYHLECLNSTLSNVLKKWLQGRYEACLICSVPLQINEHDVIKQNGLANLSHKA